MITQKLMMITGVGAPTGGDRGIFGGGYSGGPTNVIDYITINSAGDATNFGDLTEDKYALAATSDA